MLYSVNSLAALFVQSKFVIPILLAEIVAIQIGEPTDIRIRLAGLEIIVQHPAASQGQWQARPSSYPVMAARSGSIQRPQFLTHFFEKFGKKYGVKDFHPHKLRHTSASLAITNRADVVSVSERLGHSDTAVTLRMYAHANEESIRRAGQIVRDAIKAGND